MVCVVVAVVDNTAQSVSEMSRQIKHVPEAESWQPVLCTSASPVDQDLQAQQAAQQLLSFINLVPAFLLACVYRATLKHALLKLLSHSTDRYADLSQHLHQPGRITVHSHSDYDSRQLCMNADSWPELQWHQQQHPCCLCVRNSPNQWNSQRSQLVACSS